jgi:hypothetical protein
MHNARIQDKKKVDLQPKLEREATSDGDRYLAEEKQEHSRTRKRIVNCDLPVQAASPQVPKSTTRG